MKMNIPVFLSSDDNYVPFIATTVASILYNTKENIKIYILSDNISKFHMNILNSFFKKYKNIEVIYIHINNSNIFSKIDVYNGIPKTTYSRLLIPSLCTEEKVIYSDVDVIFLNDIAEFYEQDLEQFPLGAVYHASLEKNLHHRLVLEKNLCLTKGQKYFYAGNLLIDCPKWRRGDFSQRLIRLGQDYKYRINYGDQDILNMFFDTNFKLLENKFCLTSQDILYFKHNDIDSYHKLKENVVVRHFETQRKPWLTNMFQKGVPLDNFQDFWFFAEMTPFYSQLKASFACHINSDVPPDIVGNIKRPSQEILENIRNNIRLNNQKHS